MMLLKIHKKSLLFLLGYIIYLFPILSIAASVPVFEIVPNESSLTFTGIMNNVKTSGQFKTFTGDISFDPKKLNESHVRIVVDTKSINTSYVDIAETLKTADWLDVKHFPSAIFESKDFTKMGENSYQSHGNLTIRDKTLPIILTFTQEDIQNKIRVKGTTLLKRTQFGIGQGEWSSTKDVGDDVIVNFTVTVLKK